MKIRTQWTDELIEKEVRAIASATGIFPSVSDLKRLGRNDLACQVGKRGGFIHWAEKIGFPRKPSDSDTGWEGEKKVMGLLDTQGYQCVRSKCIKAPFDLLVNDVLRIDVKAARFASYKMPKGGTICSGWFYRLGKVCQADLVLFYQLDTGNFYSMPWWNCPIGNITISRDGGKYAEFLNNWPLIREMIEVRKREMFAAGRETKEAGAA